MEPRRELSDVRLVTERLVLREFALDDEDAVHSFTSDPVVTRFTDWGPNSPADTRQFLAYALAHANDPWRRGFNLAAIETGSGRLVGSVEIGVTSTDHQRGELGFVFHRDVWSRGYATEATTALLRFGFEQLGLHRISATCHPDNRASARVLEKVGMELEGRLRGHMLVRGVRRDSLLYAMVAAAAR
ncbi:GNAT family N-acetyltransferase [Actinophytocola xanthii]|uniref:N-acetyltransferase domain-containing protein n=1 Tax=Actinophytocola xanthii TaxID=1912961 RepID=A0A1Q8CAD7_9PSEU|nr:GNAT family protein [Actinophytocola xanthii]OLF11313.1 hypothetical protein BU204_30300 [Actinophytocola xanthii]